ncbi:MAG TPA: hypothetical protein PKI20_07250 [Verrucomicrobiota bacterium]|nr:hypothetical protein [Verrucomicrobiota bacterium]HQL77668.1 hypothetical protein [Verrucomicrobiota bacterium]
MLPAKASPRARQGFGLLRAWWALRCQKRRRLGGLSGGVPPAVVLDPATFFACLSAPEWVSVKLTWSYATGGLASGTFEIAKQDGVGNWATIGAAAVGDGIPIGGGVSNYQFTDEHGTTVYALLHYRVRCVCGGVQGAWSSVCDVDINNRNYAFP